MGVLLDVMRRIIKIIFFLVLRKTLPLTRHFSILICELFALYPRLLRKRTNLLATAFEEAAIGRL